MFTEDYQREVLCLCTDGLFMEKHSSLIIPEMFDSGYDEVAREIKCHWDKSKKPLSWGQLKQIATRTGVIITKDDLSSVKKRGDIDTEELLNFAKFRIVRDSLASIHVEAQNFKWDKVRTVWDKTWETIPGQKGAVRDVLRNTAETPKREGLIPTGISLLDRKLGGGVAAGNLAMVLAPTSGGKTSLLVSLAATAVEQGKSVYYVTLEVPGYEIESKVRGRLTGTENPSKKLWASTVKVLGTPKYYIDEYSPGAISPSDLYSSIPKDVDLVVVDYADYLRGPTGDMSLEYLNLGNIYVGLKRLALEKKIPVWTASQVNRSGYQGEFDLVSIEGSLKKAMVCDQAVCIKQTDTEKILDQESGLCQGSLYIAKNRHGERFVDVPITIHWATSTFKEGQFG